MSGKDGIQPLNLALKRNAYQTKRRVRLVRLSGCDVEPFWMNGDTHRAIVSPTVKRSLCFDDPSVQKTFNLVPQSHSAEGETETCASSIQLRPAPSHNVQLKSTSPNAICNSCLSIYGLSFTDIELEKPARRRHARRSIRGWVAPSAAGHSRLCLPSEPKAIRRGDEIRT